MFFKVCKRFASAVDREVRSLFFFVLQVQPFLRLRFDPFFQNRTFNFLLFFISWLDQSSRRTKPASSVSSHYPTSRVALLVDDRSHHPHRYCRWFGTNDRVFSAYYCHHWMENSPLRCEVRIRGRQDCCSAAAAIRGSHQRLPE